ncbi:MAG: glycogen synthase GlgA [Woeseiaceae bacterium]
MASKRPLKICLASSEVTPLAKTGGLADVNAALAAYLYDKGHDVRVLIPFYSSLRRDGLKIRPVAKLQNLSIAVGSRDYQYSIDVTTVPAGKLPVYLLRCPELYDRPGLYTEGDDEHLRFIVLSRVAIEMCQRMRFAPDIFHCHDWHTAMIPLFLRTIYAWDKLFANTRSVMTVHNIGYQGVFSADILTDLGIANSEYRLHQDDLSAGRINFLKTGLLQADQLTTVSPRYAEEIQGPNYGWGLDEILRHRSDDLVGILNGVDYGEWNPKSDPLIPQNYSSEDFAGKAFCKQVLMSEMGLAGGSGQPLIGIVSRLVEQKGVDLMERVLPTLLARRNFSMAVLGSGERRFEQFFESLQKSTRSRVGFYRGYSNKLAHLIEAGSDMFLMPSNYEPCGLNQMYSLKYGTIPIVRETGGLADSVQQIDENKRSGTGVLFRDYDETGLAWAISRALELFENKSLWKKIMHNGMAKDFSWDQQGDEYVTLFRRLADR